MRGSMTVLQALAMAGGFREFANTKDIRMLRRTPRRPDDPVQLQVRRQGQWGAGDAATRRHGHRSLRTRETMKPSIRGRRSMGYPVHGCPRLVGGRAVQRRGGFGDDPGLGVHANGVHRGHLRRQPGAGGQRRASPVDFPTKVRPGADLTFVRKHTFLGRGPAARFSGTALWTSRQLRPGRLRRVAPPGLAAGDAVRP